MESIITTKRSGLELTDLQWRVQGDELLLHATLGRGQDAITGHLRLTAKEVQQLLAAFTEGHERLRHGKPRPR